MRVFRAPVDGGKANQPAMYIIPICKTSIFKDKNFDDVMMMKCRVETGVYTDGKCFVVTGG